MSTNVERKDFASSKRLRDVMGQYFTALDRGPAEGKKTAWCTSVGPAELLLALGYNVYFPENHGAMLGASRMATDLIPLANARGFSPDICSYLTSDVGSYLKGESPLHKMKLSGPPKADVLVYNTNQCRDVQDWFQFYAREWNVPCLGIHTPRAIGEVDGSLTELRRRPDRGPDRAAWNKWPGASSTSTACGKWSIFRGRRPCSGRPCWKRRPAVPSPITFFDGTIQMGPAVVLRGRQEAIDYYKLLVAELQERVAKGVAAVEGERLRIYWEGMPIWGKLSPLGGLFLNARACVVASTYCNSWIFEALDPADPFRSMARAYSSIFICRSDDEKQAYIERMARALQDRRHPLSRRQDVSEQFQQPLRPAAADPGEAGAAVPGHQRRSERPADVFGRADPH